MTSKTLDTVGIILLVLANVGWLLIAVNLSFVVGKDGSGDAAIGKATSSIAALLFIAITWLLLAALLIRAGTQALMPTWAGLAATVLLLLSWAAASAAVFLLDDPRTTWPAAIPIATPVLVIGYVVCLYQPALNALMARPLIGGMVWAAVLLASLAPWPLVVRAQEQKARALDQAEQIHAQQAEAADRKKRDDGLERIAQMKPDSHLWDWFGLFERDSGVREEALAAFRTNPNRQDDFERLMGESLVTMEDVAALDIKPTPKLCAAARRWCEKLSREMRPQNGQPSYYEEKQWLASAMTGLRWFHTNGCSLEDGLSTIEDGVRTYRDTPHRQQMLQHLDELRQSAAR